MVGELRRENGGGGDADWEVREEDEEVEEVVGFRHHGVQPCQSISYHSLSSLSLSLSHSVCVCV